MIPKIIHYCWFGGNPLPESAKKCIDSWKRFFPDYEIWAWVEKPLPNPLLKEREYLADMVMTFDVNIIPYTKDAYDAKKYAFVSDYARFWILEREGGLYFDTDVEVIKNMTPIIKAGPYMGCELQDGTVNPGLGLAAEPHMAVYQQILDNYTRMNFFNPDGSRSNYSMIPMITEMFRKESLNEAISTQDILGLKIYPVEYFNPLDSLTGKLKITNNTYSIHWYMASWQAPQPLWYKKLKQYYHRIKKYICF